MKNNPYQISNELELQPYKDGVKLSKPTNNSYCMVEETLKSPLVMWFSDTESACIECNEANVIECGFDSYRDSIGKTMLHVIKKNDAIQVMNNDKEAMKYKVTKIVEETSFRKDGVFINSLSIKKPWYDENNQIIGIFGCAILLNKFALAESLNQIVKMGLLNKPQHVNSVVGKEIHSVYLSKRELECLKLTIRGKTAKEIANMLDLSKWTIEEYIANIKMKLNAKSKSELIDKTIDYFIAPSSK